MIKHYIVFNRKEVYEKDLYINRMLVINKYYDRVLFKE